MKSRIVFLASLAFGALFLWSGIQKVKDPISFAGAIRNFRIVGDPFAPGLAHLLPWLEIFGGVGVMWDRTRQGETVLLPLLLLGLPAAVISAWVRGLDIACGCFGGEELMNYPVKVAQNLGLVLWGAALCYFSAPARMASSSSQRA